MYFYNLQMHHQEIIQVFVKTNSLLQNFLLVTIAHSHRIHHSYLGEAKRLFPSFNVKNNFHAICNILTVECCPWRLFYTPPLKNKEYRSGLPSLLKLGQITSSAHDGIVVWDLYQNPAGPNSRFRITTIALVSECIQHVSLKAVY